MRNLLTRAIEFVGLDQKFWLAMETGGYGDAATNAPGVPTSGGLGHLNGNIEFNIPRENSAYRSARSVVTRLSGKKEVKWGLETYIVPGTPDMSNHPTLPDAHPMLLTAFGKVDQTDPTEIVYSFVRTSLASFRMLEEGSHFSRIAVGCVCDTVSFSLPGDGKATMKFDGFAQDTYVAGQSLVASTVTGSHSVPVTTGQGARFELGSWVDVIDGTDGNTSKVTTPRQVTGISTDTLTLSGAVVTLATGDIVIGYAPAFDGDGAENALLGLRGSFTTAAFGTVDCQLMKADIMIKNNYTPKSQYYGTSKICGFVPDKRREVTVKLEILLTKSNFEFYMNNKNFIADDLTIVLQPQDIPAPIHAALGRTLTFNMPKVEFNVPKLEQPADGLVKLTLDGICLATDIDNTDTEMTLTIS